MKKGINHWTFPKEMSLVDSFKLAKKCGFDGIEINMDEGGELNPESKEKQIKDIATSADKIGIEISSLSTSLFWKYSLTDNDKLKMEKAKEFIKKMIDTAKLLEINVILVVPGRVTEEIQYDIAYKRAQEGLKELSSYAEKNKIYIGIENVWNKFLLTPLEMQKFVDDIKSSYVQSYFDVGNVLINAYPEHWIKILGKRIKKVHIKDFKTSIGNGEGFVNLLEGDVNWPVVIKALKDIGYNDYITAELGRFWIYPERQIEITSKNMDKILGR